MKARPKEAYGQLPLSFEANVGQTGPEVNFISRGSGYTLFLKPREAVLALRKGDDSDAATVLRMKIVGSGSAPRATAQEKLAGKVNYLIGRDPSRWRTGISTYEKVAYQNLYPGVDLVYYGNQRQLEYDLVVQPGIDPNVQTIVCEGSQASIFGEATINGTSGVNFRINLQDLGKGSDTYQVILDDYYSGEQLLGEGNIQIRQK